MNLLILAAAVMLFHGLSRTCAAESFRLENRYISLSGKDGVVTSLRFDPEGNANYGRNHFINFSVFSPVPDPDVKADVEPGSRLVLRGVKDDKPMKIEQEHADFPALLREGHTLGQTFVFERGALRTVAARIPTWKTEGSAVTIKLYRLNGEKKLEIASKRVENLQDNGWIELRFADQPTGKYLIELSDVKGTAGWWSSKEDRLPGEALADDEPQPRVDRDMRCYGYESISGDLEITLEGNKLRSRFMPDAKSSEYAVEYALVMPWIKDGYDTTSDKIMFHHFLTSGGIYMPVHQFKRRPYSDISGEWVLMSGRCGADLKFTNVRIHMEMSGDRMSLNFPVAEFEMEILPHTDKLPDYFPVFFSSDPDTDRVLNEFLLSHCFNFGVGVGADWEEWIALQYDWTAHPQADSRRAQLLMLEMDSDGYVYSWTNQPGWPFPYKDDDKNGKNDYDTRHFTTNPCFILAAWRAYCWNPDLEYLIKIMPRARLAMEFILNELNGDEGILTIKAPGHEGRNNCIGSNYWDILPFGYKDAFTNAYYYPCLEAMAQLEEAVLRGPGVKAALASSQTIVHSARFYRKLAEMTRRAYKEVFWLEDKGRYSGCVDADGVCHDYGSTFVNLAAAGYGLADMEQVRRIYNWMETGITSSGKADTYSRWIFAPRANTIHNPKRDEPQTPVPSWWFFGWHGTAYDEQCQDGGAILYTSYYDIMARARFLGSDNAWKRFTEILNRYDKPDHLSGGSPLWFGETTQGGPGGGPASVGVEGEFPESGLVPVSFLYAFLGIDADIDGLKICPNLPKALEFAGIRNLRYQGRIYDIRVTNSSVEVKCTTEEHKAVITKTLSPGGTFRLKD